MTKIILLFACLPVLFFVGCADAGDRTNAGYYADAGDRTDTDYYADAGGVITAWQTEFDQLFTAAETGGSTAITALQEWFDGLTEHPSMTEAIEYMYDEYDSDRVGDVLDILAYYQYVAEASPVEMASERERENEQERRTRELEAEEANFQRQREQSRSEYETHLRRQFNLNGTPRYSDDEIARLLEAWDLRASQSREEQVRNNQEQMEQAANAREIAQEIVDDINNVWNGGRTPHPDHQYWLYDDDGNIIGESISTGTIFFQP